MIDDIGPTSSYGNTQDRRHAMRLLRRKAEQILQKKPVELADVEVAQVRELVHELDVHRVELELQNEELRQVQMDLQGAKERLGTLFQGAPMGYVVLDEVGMIRKANKAWVEMLDDVEILAGRTAFADCLVSEHAAIFRGRFRTFFRNPEGKRMEVRLRRGDGHEPRWVQLEAKPNPMGANGSGDAAAELLVTAVDISERKQLEQQREDLIQKLTIAKEVAEAASKAKSEFMSVMSHELRTPLNPVVALTEMLLSETVDPQHREYLEIIRTSAANQLALVEDILDFCKLESGRIQLDLQPVPLALLADELMKYYQPQATQKGLELEVEIEDTVPEIIGADASRLRQILDNLLSNALKFTHKGKVRLEMARDDSLLTIGIIDTGIGIATDKQVRIFDPFTQVDSSMSREFGGTGLGLSISRSLARMMGGEINVHSVAGQGSRFYLELPLHPPPDPVPLGEELQQPEAEAKAALHVLVVEDDPANQHVTRLLLERDGHTVDVARDGEMAWRKLRAHKYDLVLMDIRLPGINGIELARKVRAELPALRQPWILAQTAQSTHADRRACMDAGMDDYLSKPFSPAALRLSIAQLGITRKA